MSKVSDAVWGNEQAYFNQPPANVPPDAWWISIVFFWLLLPLNLIMALLCVFIDPMFRWIGSLAMFSTLHGRPLWMAWAIWWYQIATALQLLVRSGKSRFTLFSRSRAIYGGGEWWWHGELPTPRGHAHTRHSWRRPTLRRVGTWPGQPARLARDHLH